MLVLQNILPLCITRLLFFSTEFSVCYAANVLTASIGCMQSWKPWDFPLFSCMSIAVKTFFSSCKCWNVENMMNVKLFNNILFYGIKRNPVIVSFVGCFEHVSWRMTVHSFTHFQKKNLFFSKPSCQLSADRVHVLVHVHWAMLWIICWKMTKERTEEVIICFFT